MNVICGLPRSGSTLLCNVLNQNPVLWASSTSLLPSLCATLVHVWSNSPELKVALNQNSEKTEELLKNILKTVCEKWHRGKEDKIIFDKSRAWAHNLLLLKSIYPDAKIIVTVRDLREVFASVEKQHRRTGFLDEASGLAKKTIFGRADTLFSPDGLIGGPLAGIEDILNRKFDVHWVKYEEFAQSPRNTLAKIYAYLDVVPWEHDFDNVINVAEDPDWLYNGKFPHEGKGKVSKPENQWHKYMSDSIADLIVTKFSKYQKQFNYGR
jgi:sulfotransferase